MNFKSSGTWCRDFIAIGLVSGNRWVKRGGGDVLVAQKISEIDDWIDRDDADGEKSFTDSQVE